MRVRSPRGFPLDQRPSSTSGSKRLLLSKKPSLPHHGRSITPSSLYTQSKHADNDATIDVDTLDLQYFVDKYGAQSGSEAGVLEEMRMVLSRKKNEVHSLAVYRDELRLIAGSEYSGEPAKVDLGVLKEKADLEEKLAEARALLEREIDKIDRQLEVLSEYQKFMVEAMSTSDQAGHAGIGIEKEQEVLLRNLEAETEMLIKELGEEQKKNSREIRQIQDQILQYRIVIKEKQDKLRALKAKICTLYIKLNSRNKSRSNSKSKDRSMSLSVKKFNSQQHSSIKEVFIGNSIFKSYSREIIEKVSPSQQLIKIRFYLPGSTSGHQINKSKDEIFFQCIYKGREGQVHDNRDHLQANQNGLSSQDRCEEVKVKYLSSLKFFYKSKIVGVECRVKSDRGTRNWQIGNCDPHIQHELLTLVNKRVVTLGSFWHGKEMVGVSVWYADQPKGNPSSEKDQEPRQAGKKSKQKSAYEEYYS